MILVFLLLSIFCCIAQDPADLAASFNILYPSNVAGLKIWYSGDSGVYSDAGSTPCVDGNSVQQWNDRSGGGFHATQLTSARKPVYRASAINNLPAIDVGVATDASITNRSVGTLNQPLSVFVVFFTTNATGKYIFRSANPLLWLSSANVLTFNSGGNIIINIQSGKWYQATLITSTTAENTTTRFWATRAFINGRKQGVIVGNSTAFDFLRLGDYVNGPVDGMIAEFIMFTRNLSDSERYGIELYLKRKYALQEPF